MNAITSSPKRSRPTNKERDKSDSNPSFPTRNSVGAGLGIYLQVSSIHFHSPSLSLDLSLGAEHASVSEQPPSGLVFSGA
jgi:hypothetical protein